MDKKLILFILIFFLVLVVFSVSVFFATTSRKIRATQQETSEVLCITDAISIEIGQTANISCVARDENSNTVSNVECCFATSLGEFSPICGNTDQFGSVTSALASQTDGIADITCTVGGSITANTSVEFY